MRLGTFWHAAGATLAVATLAIGCASSGGGDTEKKPVSTSEFKESPSDGSGLTETGVHGLLENVLFDFDSSAIRSDQRVVLQGNVKKINDNASWKSITIEGNCDERGSEEYNLALGERRAAAVKQYLIDSGVSGSKLDTVSFGEAKPAVQGHDESAWKWNRRVEFAVTK